ncbi:MAG: PilW family protein [Legionellaceae bacterium]
MRQRGFGLIELCIGLALTTGLMILLVEHVRHTRVQYERIETFMDESMTLQWVSDLIRHSVQSAGFTPCLRVDHLISDQNGRSFSPLDVIPSPHARLTIRRMDEEVVRVLSIPSPLRVLVASSHLRLNRPVIIADCYHAEVHALEAIQSTPSGSLLILKRPLQFTYDSTAYVGAWVVESFFIKNASLYYQQTRVDGLSRRIVDFYATLSKQHHQIFLKMRLKLQDGHAWSLDTMARAK